MTCHEDTDGEYRHRSTISLTSALNGDGCLTPRPGQFTRRSDPVPTVQEAGRAQGLFWTGAEYLAPTGIGSPGLPARSESLYRLSYPGPQKALTGML